MVTESHLQACPRCHARDVAVTACPRCGGLSHVSCRHCPHDACRDALCELEARDAAFRRQLRAVLLLMCILVAAIINFAGPLQRVELYRTQPALSP